MREGDWRKEGRGCRRGEQHDRPFMISDTALKEFKEIWRAEFGDEIADDIAVEEAVNLLALFNVVYRPVKRSEIDEYEER